MEINNYQKWTESTAVYPKKNELPYLGFGLANEVGELLGLLKKPEFRGDEQPERYLESIKKEMGDIQWYLNRLASYYKLEMNDILQTNIDKLESRKQRDKLKGSGDNR